METTQFIVRDSITISEHEQKIFNTLVEVLKLNGKTTTLRVAGGWVRDKLIGKESHDIDIAMDDMMGKEFAEMINKHLYPGQLKYGIIKKDAEKSKHLETATIKVHDYFVDLVNLRYEEYTEEGRAPIIGFGTPLQDAERRDLTINSLFYNIQEQKVEDLTGRGIDDLKNGII
jgi:tRNA nucleotidyltransferase (CCA-adding enzyme)